MYRETAEELLKFIEKSPSPFHAVETMKEELLSEGYEEVKETEKWSLNKGENILFPETAPL